MVPPDAAAGTADAAMMVAAATTNRIHAEHILLAVSAPTAQVPDGTDEDAEGARIGATPTPAT